MCSLCWPLVSSNRRVRPLVIAIAALVACTPTVTASPSPSVSAVATLTATPSSAPSATPSPSPTADPSRYGYVTVSPGRIVVRRERETDSALAIGGEHPAASHDGKRIAFWRTGPQGNNPQELRVVAVASGAETGVTTIPAGQAGGAIVWANDDGGLLYEIHSTATFPGVGGGPMFSTLNSWDLSAPQPPGQTATDLRLTNGAVFVPLAWDRAGQMASALTTGEGGFAIDYVTWDRKVVPAGANPVKSTRFPWQVVASSVRASHDGKTLLAVRGAENALSIWGIDDISKSVWVMNTQKIGDAQWRPSSGSDIAWVLDNDAGIFTYGGPSGSSPVTRFIHRGQAQVRIAGWRADGSGVLLSEIGRGIFVVDLTSLQATPLPHLGAVVGDGVLLR